MAQSMRASLNAVTVPGGVGMDECSLDLFFFKLQTVHLFFLVGAGALFSTA